MQEQLLDNVGKVDWPFNKAPETGIRHTSMSRSHPFPYSPFDYELLQVEI